MNITFREMEKNEQSLVRKIGRPSFGITEQFLFPKPKNALIAMVNGEIVGATTYKIFSIKNHQKIGYIETAFIKKGHEGKGLGSKLYSEITAFLKMKGCTTITAIVRDDNVASWKLFKNNGYGVTTFSQMRNSYGLWGAISLWFHSILCVAVGHHLWSTTSPKNSSSVSQLGFYLFLNLFVLFPALLFGSSLESFFISASAILVLLISSVCGGGVSTILTKEKWSFRVSRGGILVSLIVAGLGGTFPVVGRFYPEEYKDTPIFKRNMGIEGFFEWITVFLFVIVAFILKESSVFWNTVLDFGTSILLYHALPFCPFECFGGKRIWDYHKFLSLLLLVISTILLFIW